MKSIIFQSLEIPSEEVLRKKVREYLDMRKIGRESGICEKQVRRWLRGENSMIYSNIEKLISYLLKES